MATGAAKIGGRKPANSPRDWRGAITRFIRRMGGSLLLTWLGLHNAALLLRSF